MYKILIALYVASCTIAPLHASDVLHSDTVAEHEDFEEQSSSLITESLPLAGEESFMDMDASMADDANKNLRVAPIRSEVKALNEVCDSQFDKCEAGTVCCIAPFNIPFFKFTCRPANSVGNPLQSLTSRVSHHSLMFHRLPRPSFVLLPI
jgi:hypothetical protein